MAIPRQEAQWILRAQCGDREALEALLRSVQLPLYRYVRSLVGEDDAEDVLQNVLILICRKLSSLHAPELFRPWIYRIASREAFRHLKKQKRRPDRVAVLDIPLGTVKSRLASGLAALRKHSATKGKFHVRRS